MHKYRSETRFHYPQITFRDGKKYLWNPILKKAFVNRPEERVRLQLVEYFTRTAGISPHKLSFESPVKTAVDKTQSRTDIIIYDEQFKPLVLVECKSRDITLDEKTAKQAARYFARIQCPYILLSNGSLDYWFEMEANSKRDNLKPLKAAPEFAKQRKDTEKNFIYWQERGFAGINSKPEIRNYISESCRSLYNSDEYAVMYLSFDGYASEYSLGNYYTIQSLDADQKVAIALSSTPYGDTRLNVILNQAAENKAFLTASLNLIADGETINAEIHSAKGITHIDLKSTIDFSFEKKVMDFIMVFQQILLQFS